MKQEASGQSMQLLGKPAWLIWVVRRAAGVGRNAFSTFARGHCRSSQYTSGRVRYAGTLAAIHGTTRNVHAPKPELRIMRYELSDYGWTAIKPMLPNKPRGVRRVNRSSRAQWHFFGFFVRVHHGLICQRHLVPIRIWLRANEFTP